MKRSPRSQPDQSDRIRRLLHSFFAPRPAETPSEWCCRNLWFDEPKNSGPYRLEGREYLREPLDWWGDPLQSDGVCVFGTQSGKTTQVMGGVYWTAANNPDRFLWVMPTKDKAGEFSRTRAQKMVRRSDCLRNLIPTGGQARHSFSTFHQALGASQIDFAWSNSPTALSSNPCGVVVLDEVDKFPAGGKEADAVSLAEQRTKNSATPKRMKTSTPTLVEGPIWQEFLKTDMRRWFVPCPHCSKFFVLVWSKVFTVFKCTGEEAEIRWDKTAQNPDGSWNLDEVERTARAECPHCGGHVRDGHKTAMNRGGEWRPTNPKAAKGYRGWHLPSLYSISPECNFGRLARKFLQDQAGLTGLQDFINSDLAEPYMSQDTQGDRVEMILDNVLDASGRLKILSVDVQVNAPYFWYAAMLVGGGEVQIIDAAHLDSFEELETKQKELVVDDMAVCIDSGDQTKGDDSVYVHCAHHSILSPRRDRLPALVGWTPCKGMPVRKRWKNAKGAMVPYRIWYVDPYDGTTNSNRVEIGLFEFSGDYFKDVLELMRRGKAHVKFSVLKSVATEEFWRHMDSNHKATFYDKRTNRPDRKWVKKSKYWPDHILDCVVQGLGFATHLGCLTMTPD